MIRNFRTAAILAGLLVSAPAFAADANESALARGFRTVSDLNGSLNTDVWAPISLATASAKAAAQGAAALITMLPDGKIVRQAVLEGQDPAIEGLEAGAVVMDMSSSNPVDTQKLARDLAAAGALSGQRSHLVDCPPSLQHCVHIN